MPEFFGAQPDHPDFRHFRQRWVEGLVCGVDPTHDEYWGEPGDKDQRYVEMGAIVSIVRVMKANIRRLR
jgi:hypothetical protein